MEFKIHAHACLEVISEDKSLICDPWLVGSAYWRSWWNYPPLRPNILDKVRPDYIYITHIHWDHFHGPTLRKLGTDKTVIIPKTPELRLLNDIKSIGFKKIIEIEHGQTFEISPNFRLTSYQFGPIFADSVLTIEVDNQVLLNSNDAKVMGLPLKQILQNHPQIDFVFRSHSSANSRLCYELLDDEGKHIDNDIRKYSEEFSLFAQRVGARYAIPFASNQCCLHPETIGYNQYNNYAHNVARFFDESRIKTPECIVMAPGDSWSTKKGFSLRDNSKWYDDPNRSIKEYQMEKANTIKKVVAKESNSKIKIPLAQRYAEWIIKETPWFIRRLFKNRPITIIGHSQVETKGLEIDLYNQKYEIIENWDVEKNPIQIYVNNAVINDVWAKKHWNSLGVSKRLKIKLKRENVKYYQLFNFLNNALEAGALQSKNIFTSRYISIYLKRWRELVLYINIIVDRINGKPFSYKKYLDIK
ncbi:MBL fold metallo-hydrolase [Cyanobacterium aponinum UTEX 3222]|uniref:MBL fold metallo-hydrolase n=1 Tax=Cyanobacterium aponinum TaxID=379064 RepID=UPI0030915BE8|nr:MBL fold metallo-hydrolase [Cyanobacterium aponinum UTEX 3222]